MNNKIKPELLAPAGNLNKLKIAIKYGADAVYIGGRDFSLRANADNFSIDEIREATTFAHDRGAKVYVTVNIVFHNEDLNGLEDYLLNLEKVKVDAIIISDPIVIEYANKVIPNMEIHLSTQTSTANYEAIKYWLELGVKRIILARETSKEEIKEIIEKTGADIEIFIHGAMCVGYSGRCALSNYLTMRDSNRGGCSQICRWDFELQNGEKEKVDEVNFSIASKDLMLAKHIPELIDMNVRSFKIEGRMRSIYYIATVVGIYRKIIDEYISNSKNFEYNDEYKNILNRCANREATTQFYDKLIDYTDQYYKSREEKSNQDFLGIVIGYDKKTKLATIQQRNLFKVGDKVTIFGPEIDDLSFVIDYIIDDENNKIEVVRHPQQIVKIPVNKEVYIDNMVRINND